MALTRWIPLAIALALAALALVTLAGLMWPSGSGSAQEQRPANDDFGTGPRAEIPVSPLGSEGLNYVNVQPTGGATLQDGESAPCGDIGATVWYFFDAPRTGTFEIDTAGSDFDTIVAVYTLGGFVPSPPGENLADVACADGAGAARLTFDGVQGEGYHIQVGGAGGATGTLRLRVSCSPACPPPNDNWENATQPFFLPFEDRLNTSGATLQAGEPAACGFTGATVWYKLAVSEPGIGVTVDARESDFAPAIALYESQFVPSPPGGLTELRCVLNIPGSPAVLGFEPEPFKTYLVQIGGQQGATGNLVVRMTCPQGECALLGGGIPGPETGQGGGGPDAVATPAAGGAPGVRGPDTGSGGYR
jgi:hypothetical protein